MREQDIKQSKLNLLLKSPKNLFHTQDLFLLWAIDSKNTLYTTIMRYVKKGVLIRIQKGLYSKTPLGQIDPVEIGMAFLHSFSYLSTETILSQVGVISQPIPYITLISNQSKKFKIKNHFYISRQMKNAFLFNEAGIIEKNNIKQATLERAVADMLYFSPKYHFDVPKSIDWDKVKEIQKIIGYK
ncbi:hypothetical protein KKC63_01825 [Patescibacteria group bacterium]|nr:hypothetical protein [Patescibacteria group bacterium]MBU4022873.1 hypothetical protein [Patescibacteria group bacterium]MBU4078117.1 hypothetical protein [Patescibacteria group bacterium]